jgi:hypothetical protein
MMMISVYDLVIKSDEQKQTAKSRIILRLVQQTTECASFLREYSVLKTFGRLSCLTIGSLTSYF